MPVSNFIKYMTSSSFIVFFSKPGCQLCDQLDNYLTNNYYDFKQIKLTEFEDDEGIDIIKVLKNENEVTTFPIVFMNGVFVGTTRNVIERLERESWGFHE